MQSKKVNSVVRSYHNIMKDKLVIVYLTGPEYLPKFKIFLHFVIKLGFYFRS